MLFTTTPTLDRVRANGAIYVGYRESSIPFSYMVGDEVVGYSTELCDCVVDAVRAKLDYETVGQGGSMLMVTAAGTAVVVE